MTLIHALLFILVSGIVILAILLVKKIKELRTSPEESDDTLNKRVHELIHEAAEEDAKSDPEKKLDFDE